MEYEEISKLYSYFIIKLNLCMVNLRNSKVFLFKRSFLSITGTSKKIASDTASRQTKIFISKNDSKFAQIMSAKALPKKVIF